MMSVEIPPASGDYGTPTATRFVESLVFNLARMNETEGKRPPTIEGCGTMIQEFKF